MNSSKENNLSVDEVFKRWVADVRVDRVDQYKYGSRKRHVQDLMGYLKQYNIDFEDAQMLKRKVVETLVSETGLKGSKKEHKGWKENVENDFEDAIQIAYIPGLSKLVPIKTAQGYDPLIVAWAKKRFGDHVGEEMIKAAHQPLHVLWTMFLKDQYKLETERETL